MCEERTNIYHEKQSKQMCALHALNNLFQHDSFSKQELDEICQSMSPNVWINPHRSVLGLGNYDVNVIMSALQKRGCEAFWFDKRKDPSLLCLERICGFIFNVPSDYHVGFVRLPLNRRHWFAVRKIDGTYYNLDSKLDSPQCIGQEQDLFTYISEQLKGSDIEFFVVVAEDNSEKWLKKDELIST